MITIPLEDLQFVDKNGMLTNEAQTMLNTVFQAMQQDLSNQGFVIPAPSITDISELEGEMPAGTFIFDESVENGGTPTEPLGQLKVMLADGTWHAVTNT